MSLLTPSTTLLLLLLWCCHFMIAFGSSISNINNNNANANSHIDASAVSIENDVLHFSYELERTWLDGDKQPCQNFFDFVCGRTLNGSEAQQLFAQRQRQTEQKKFEKFLANENDDDEQQLMDAELKLKMFYMSCKEARSLEDLKSTLMYRSAGGWPAVDESASMIRKRRNITWLGVLSAFHDAGFEYFFGVNVQIKSNKRVVLIQPDATMRFTLRKFEQLASDILEESAIDGGRARLVALEIMNFERNRREIAKMQQQTSDEPQELTYADFKVSFLGSSASENEWDAYFKRTLGKALKPSDTVLVRQMEKLKQYFGLLQNTTMTRFLNWIWIDYLMDKNITDCQTLTRHYFEPVYQNIVERILIDKVKMAQMYTDLTQSYEQLFPPSVWIDEMSQQRSKQFHGRVMHLTLNGDSQLDSELADLTLTRRNFYRNLEKMQKHLQQQQKRQQQQQHQFNSRTHSQEESHFAGEFMKTFLMVGGAGDGGGVGALQAEHNLTMPLNYILVAKRFAEMMIASGGSSTTPGAWRSMDSENEFATFKECLNHQMAEEKSSESSNPNDLLLHILAHRQALNALNVWQAKNAALWNRLDRLLSAGRLKLTLRKLYFINALLADCHSYKAGKADTAAVVQRYFVHSYLRNLPEFSRTFNCRNGDVLHTENTCRVL